MTRLNLFMAAWVAVAAISGPGSLARGQVPLRHLPILASDFSDNVLPEIPGAHWPTPEDEPVNILRDIPVPVTNATIAPSRGLPARKSLARKSPADEQSSTTSGSSVATATRSALELLDRQDRLVLGILGTMFLCGSGITVAVLRKPKRPVRLSGPFAA